MAKKMTWYQRVCEINLVLVKIQARSEEVLDQVRTTEMEQRGWIQDNSEQGGTRTANEEEGETENSKYSRCSTNVELVKIMLKMSIHPPI